MPLHFSTRSLCSFLFLVLSTLYAEYIEAQNAIGVTAISGTPPYCAGTSVNVTYTITGTYSNTPTSNVFTAQLSDANGSFATPVSIGTRTATTSGTINGCVIPYNTGTSTLYRIRVISSNPALFGSDNGYNFTVNAPTISAPTIANTVFCQSEVFNLSFTKTCNFVTGNVYTIQLSDASGSFASPVTMSTYTSTGSGTFSTSIPAGTPAGSGYRIRVVSSNPVIAGPDNGTNLTINASAGAPSVFGNGVWNVYDYNVFNNFAIDYQGYYTDPALSFSTTAVWTSTDSPSSAAGYSGCPFGNTNYSVASKRTGVPCGYYQIDVPSHDDYAYFYFNNTLVWSHIGCCDAHTNVWSGFIRPSDSLDFRFTNGGGPGNMTVSIYTVNPLVMSPPVTVCAGTTATLSVINTSTYSVTYAWAPTANLNTSSGATVIATPSSTTIYTVSATDARTGCAISNTVQVTVNPAPTTSVATTSTLTCYGLSSATMTATGANTYSWSPSSGLNATTGYSVIATPSVTTTYTVRGSNNCSTVNATATVSVQTVPATPTPTVFGNGVWNVYCYNDLTMSSYYGYYTENNLSFNTTTRWSTNNPSFANAASGLAYQGCQVGVYHATDHRRTNFTCGYYQLDIPTHDDNVTVLINGVQVFQHLGCCDSHTNVWQGFLGPSTTVEIQQSNNGAGSSYLSATFTSIAYPVLSPPVTICQGTSTNLNASPIITGANYVWTPSVSVSPATGYTTVATPTTTTIYTCTVTDPVTLCNASQTVKVTVNPVPTTTIAPSFTISCASIPATLTVSGANTYSWSPSTGLSASTGYSVVANPSVTTVYTVTGSNNCFSSTATTTVTVIPLVNPSVFPSNTWNAYCYNDQTLTSYYGYYTENGSGASGYNFNSTTRWSSAVSGTVAPSPSNANSTNGQAYAGCVIPNTNYSISFKRTNFACSVYSISISHDDNMSLLINGTQVAQHNGTATDNNIWVGVLNASSTVEIRHVQTTSTAYISATLTPAATSTTQSVWTGGTSSDWFTASNWCGNGVPTPSLDALIPAAGPQYMPIIGASGAQCKSITITGSVTAGTYNSAIPAATLTVNGAYGLDVYGSWTNNGSFSAGTGTVNLLGATSTSVSSSSSESFYNLQINKTGAATVTIPSGTHQVAGQMTFINGVVNQNAVLQILNGATVSGASNSSYVNGQVVKYGTNAFTFPVGAGGLYRPASISSPTVATDNFTAQYFNTNPNGTYSVYSKDATLDHLSVCEYWIINRTGGTSNVNVTLTWNTNSCGVTNLADLRVARWDAGQVKWKDHGNGGTTGNFSTGSIITSAPVTLFSPFTLASVNANNPLPIEMLSFSCHVANSNAVQLDWQTATEINSHYFVPERSADGMHFDSLGYVSAAGNSMQVRSYSFADPHPRQDLSYYRLKKVDQDGSHTYSDLCALDNDRRGSVLVYPNPATNHLVIDYRNASETPVFSVHDIAGRLLTVPYTTNNEIFTLDVSGLQRGLYFITLTMGSKQVVTKVTVQ